jgi:hypothetical protein
MSHSGAMPISVYLLTICLPLGTVLLIFAMKYFAAAFQARARLANDEAYRLLAQTAATVQLENQAALAAIRADLSKVTASLAAVEKILQQVN